MILRTDRLDIHILTKEQFQQYIGNASELWDSLGVKSESIIEPWFKEILVRSLHAIDELSCNACWLSDWPIVDRTRQLVVGGIAFKGPPNRDGEVEIGYGITETQQNRGYMSECIPRVVQWAFAQEVVLSVIAETDKNNRPSEIVLGKSGFRKHRETAAHNYWKINRDIIN